MREPLDAIVLGLGATGSSALYQLAKRGSRVLGIDRYSPPHALGSSHGETRITRLAIGEGEAYTPLAMRSHQIWREIEALTGRSLLTVTGGLVLTGEGPRADCHVAGFFDNTVAAAKRHGIDHELLDAPEIRARFPQFRVGDDEVGYFEPGAGFLRPEACVEAQLELAGRLGARIHREERVARVDESGGMARVSTDRGEYRARRVILAAGAWLPPFLGPRWSGLFTIRRQTLFWFDVKGPIAEFEPGRFPVFIWGLAGRAQPSYGFPAIDGPRGGIKIASEQDEVATTAESVDREVTTQETREAYEALVRAHFPGVSGDCVKARACLYTVTPDFQFVIDAHPEAPSVLVASPCSGHGFKHSPAIGEALAELVLDGTSRLDLKAFSLARFGA